MFRENERFDVKLCLMDYVFSYQVNGDQIVLPSGSKVVASYNSSTASKNGNYHIIVPGAAPVYLPPRPSSEHDHTSGPGRSRRKNTAASGRTFTVAKVHAELIYDDFEPLFRSIDICSPGFEMGNIDMITDRVNLSKLLGFCYGPSSR